MNETPGSILREVLLHIQHEFGLSITEIHVTWLNSSTMAETRQTVHDVDIQANVRI